MTTPAPIAGGNIWPYQNVSRMEITDIADLKVRYQNMFGTPDDPGFGGEGFFDENVEIFGNSVSIPFAHTANKFLGSIANKLNGNDGKNPFEVAGYGATGFAAAGGGVAGGPAAGTGGAGNGVAGFVPGQGGSSFGAVLPTPNSFAATGGGGGFGNTTNHLFGVVAPKLAGKEATLAGLRDKIASNETLSQNEMLQYQDLMQQQNQLFMFAQNVFTSEHEKIKGWAQGLGRI